jgi:hypothetical protein
VNQREGLTDVNEAVCIRLSCDDVETRPDLSEEAAVRNRVVDEDVADRRIGLAMAGTFFRLYCW